MWKPFLLWLCLSGYCLAGPIGSKRNMPIIQRQEEDMEKESTAVSTQSDANKPEGVSSTASTAPNMLMISTLTLPSNATSIRGDITDGFSCANKSYGYYADVENDCQIFHVCLPVTYADGRENTFRWSFICPEETIFSQDSFTCMRRDDMMIDCEESARYYELNRNFGMMKDEDESKPVQNTAETQVFGEDQETAMTMNVEHEKNTQQAQIMPQQQHIMSVESPSKPMFQPAKPLSVMTQKEKPSKIQKPHRRKPQPVTASLSSDKKKPAPPMRKVTPTVSAIATTAEAIKVEAETKPPRYTKRPSMQSLNLKEKIQPVKQTEPAPNRMDLYSQKRKRPTVFNKKESTTLKISEDVAPATEQPVPQDVTVPLEIQKDSDKVDKNISSADPITPEASETKVVLVSPTTDALRPNEAKITENKKISKPQPTEPEVIINPTATELEMENAPAIIPIEAIEEIPAIIEEVEESSNSNQKVTQNLNQNPETTATEMNGEQPAIFQQNSEENLGASSDGQSIEEMEEQRPANAPDSMPATLEMEHQDPVIEQMLSETDSDGNKETMGGFKPVDPAMAAEAEALIANFLNTLMKSDKTNGEPIMPPNYVNPNNESEGPTREPTSQETNAEVTDTEIPAPSHSGMEEQVQPFPSMMMMNDHPGDVFQIPVQVIQAPIEESMKVESLEVTPQPQPIEVLSSEEAESSRPISIDDVVELVKDQLDQVPESDKKIDSPNEEPSELTEDIKEESMGDHQPNEQLILPIYHRVSSEPNSNMITAHTKIEKPEDAASPEPSLDTSLNTSDPATIATIDIAARSNINRAQRARSIKTASKMDPRKRRFLFKSDAS